VSWHSWGDHHNRLFLCLECADAIRPGTAGRSARSEALYTYLRLVLNTVRQCKTVPLC